MLNKKLIAGLCLSAVVLASSNAFAWDGSRLGAVIMECEDTATDITIVASQLI